MVIRFRDGRGWDKCLVEGERRVMTARWGSLFPPGLSPTRARKGARTHEHAARERPAGPGLVEGEGGYRSSLCRGKGAVGARHFRVSRYLETVG